MDKSLYKKYASDVLNALLDNEAASGIAPGTKTPYMRAELEFPDAEAPRSAPGKFTDYIKGKGPLPIEPNELSDLAKAIENVLKKAFALGDGTRLTIEAPVTGAAVGRNVSFFIYSDSHASEEELFKYIRGNHRQIRRRFDQQFGNAPGGPG